MYVANGVVGVRSMAGNPKEIFGWRADVAEGRLTGPEIVASGLVLDGPEPSRPEEATPIATGEEGRRAVHEQKAAGADFVKVYDGLPREAYFAIAAQAKTDHIPFVGHVPSAVRAIETSEAGQGSIEHLAGALEGMSRAEDAVMAVRASGSVMREAMATKNFSLIPQSIAETGNRVLDALDPERTRRLFETFARNRTAMVPTLTTNRARTFIDEISASADPRLKYVPSDESEWWTPTRNMFSRYRTPDYIAYRKRAWRASLDAVGAMQRAGVPILTGTDISEAYQFPGFSLHDELALLVEAGLTPMQALRAATANVAAFLGRTATEGTIAPGKIANLVLLDADPLADIKNVGRIHAVILRGRLFRRSDLDAMLKKAEN